MESKTLQREQWIFSLADVVKTLTIHSLEIGIKPDAVVVAVTKGFEIGLGQFRDAEDRANAGH